jgi:hypothetical protein
MFISQRPRRPAWMFLALFPLMAAPAGARLVDAIVNYDGLEAATLPKKLSATGLYDNIASPKRKVTEGIKPYHVNVALWSDGAHKTRWIQVPAGTHVVPTDTDYYNFPNKTVFIKNFAIDTVTGDSSTSILIETRFLVVLKSDLPDDPNPSVHGISYKWRRDQTEAELVDQDAGLDTLHLVKKGGKLVGKRWRYPDKFNCNECHMNRGVLGFISPQLNDGKQLKALADSGVLTVDPFAGKKNSFRWYAGTDKAVAATLEARARSYLAANCSHCHGGGNSYESCTHNFDYLTAAPNIKYPAEGGYVGKSPLQDYSGVYPALVDAGKPESSFVLFRMTRKSTMEISQGLITTVRNDSQMPPLATYQIDSANVDVVQKWICSLKGASPCNNMPPTAADSTFWDQSWRPSTAIGHVAQAAHRPSLRAFFRGPILVLAGKGSAPGAYLYDYRGSQVPLQRAGEREYRPARQLRAGAYVVKMGNALAKVNYLP